LFSKTSSGGKEMGIKIILKEGMQDVGGEKMESQTFLDKKKFGK